MKRLFLIFLLFFCLTLTISPVMGAREGDWSIDDDLIEESIQEVLDAFMDAGEEVIYGLWDQLVLFLSGDMLGVDSAVLVFIITTALCINKLMTGSFIPRRQ